MSSRLAAPVSKLTRSISTTPSIARPSSLLSNGSKSVAAKAGRKRQHQQQQQHAAVIASASASEDPFVQAAIDVSPALFLCLSLSQPFSLGELEKHHDPPNGIINRIHFGREAPNPPQNKSYPLSVMIISINHYLALHCIQDTTSLLYLTLPM